MFPDYNSLNSLWQGSPTNYVAAQNLVAQGQQAGLAQVMQQQEAAKAAQLKNLFDQQANPLRLQQQQLQNQGLGLDNTKKQDEVDIMAITKDARIKEAMSKAFRNASDDEMAMLKNSAEQLSMSQNPQERMMGQIMLQGQADFLKEREKNRMQAEREQANIRATGQEQRALRQMEIDAGRFDKNKAGTYEERVRNARNFQELATVYLSEANARDLANDKAGADAFRQLADQAAAADFEARQASAMAVRPGTIDVNQIGAPTLPQQSRTPIAPPAAQPQQIPQRPQPGVPPGLPVGTVPLGDGTFRLPDGRRVRPKQGN